MLCCASLSSEFDDRPANSRLTLVCVGWRLQRRFSIKLARASSDVYLNSSVVLFTELFKFVFSSIFLTVEKGSFESATSVFCRECRYNSFEMIKLAVPGLAYTIQNNLIFLSVDMLSAAVQQVTYQLKIMTAALLSVTILGRTIGPKRWISLFILLAGVILVQVPYSSPSPAAAKPQDPSTGSGWGLERAVVGFFAALGACFASGFGGVYMEMVLKGSPESIWLRNMQLAIFGMISAAMGIVSQDLQKALAGGLTQGYTGFVWLMALTVAGGGLLVAAVLKYADNILRQFSTAISVILTTGLSAFVLKEITLDAVFGVGTILTIGATFMYSGLLDRLLPACILS